MKKKVWLFFLIILLSVTVVVVFGIKLFREYHSTPEKAIKFYVLVRNGPWAASKVTIIKGNSCNQTYDYRQYIVEGYRDRKTGMEIMFFYLSKDENGLWEVTSVGTGP
ncbi:hypothetical protein Calhy_0212 [Caldicellulosiruptor hydrothermalis 108]|uniref:Uncharacterized protein n=1 Tax=Caldicellulosiruptor hydrothermalis (strain DSM 18901 / VKM B-2411 / 108) TaxID=632292 RepID=E4QAP5_CALH1|nr:hypothetical protein [Caldicellulosiruptor hydrothermalis]ADQ05970.1 hypothetical protein Calhy_0212 [Caldicellulosiruptor hydrothermalis 108]